MALEENYNTLSSHTKGTPWIHDERRGYLDNEAANNPVEADLSAIESLARVTGGLF